MRVLHLAGAASVYAASRNPVDNVVKMLEDMAAELTKDAKTDKKVYDKLSCWCKATIPAAEAAIEAASTCIKEETATAKAQTGIANERASQIAKLEESIQERSDELKKKNEEAAKRTQEQKSNDAELTKILTAIDGALEKLGGGSKAFLQVTEKEMSATTAVLRQAMDNYGMKIANALRPSQRKLLNSFLAQPSYGAYQSQSGGIIGILSSMKDEFTADQENDAAEYEKFMAAYSEAKAILEKTIASEKETVAKKTEEKLAAEAAASDATTAAEECKKQLEDETGLRASAIDTCQTAAKDYETRTADREKETKAVAEAIKILTSPEIRSTFDKMSGAVTFIQESEESMSHKAKKVTAALRAAGTKYKDARFMILAQQVSMLKKREGWQKKVCAAVKKVISEIETDIANDLEEKDGCVAAINDLEKKIQDLENDISAADADLEAINIAIETLTAQIDELEANIAAKKKDMNEMTDRRQEEHDAFLEQQKFDSASVKFVKQAMAVLESVYKQNSFIQQPAQPQGFGENKKKAGGSVLTALQDIVNTTEQALADNLEEENQSLAVYEQFVKETNASIVSAQETVDTKTGERAQKETERVNKEEELKGLNENKSTEEKALEAKKASCKFIQDNFEVRKTAMNQEKKELVDALVILEC